MKAKKKEFKVVDALTGKTISTGFANFCKCGGMLTLKGELQHVKDTEKTLHFYIDGERIKI